MKNPVQDASKQKRLSPVRNVELETHDRRGGAQGTSFKSSVSNLDPFAAEIWQLVSNPKTEEQELPSPVSPSEVLAKSKTSIKKKLGAIVHSGRPTQETEYPGKFISVEALTSALSANPVSKAYESPKKPVLGEKLSKIDPNLSEKSRDPANKNLPYQKQITYDERKGFDMLMRKSSMPVRVTETAVYRNTNTPGQNNQDEALTRHKEMTSPREASYYYGGNFDWSVGKKPEIKEFRNSASDFRIKTLPDQLGGGHTSATHIKIVREDTLRKTSQGTTGLGIVPNKTNTFSQNLAIKNLLSQGFSLKAQLKNSKDVSFLLSSETRPTNISQRVCDVLGEKLSRKLRTETTQKYEKEGMAAAQLNQTKVEEIKLKPWLDKLAGGEDIPASGTVSDLKPSQPNPLADTSFGPKPRNSPTSKSPGSTKLIPESETPLMINHSPLSESEVISLANHTSDFYSLSCKFSHLSVTNEQLLYSLHKHVPNLLQNKPSSRHETVELSNWYFRQLEKVQSKQDRESVCRLTVLESLRQFYVTNGQRTLLLMVALEELLGSYFERYSVKKKQLEDHQTYFYETLGTRAAAFDEEVANQQKQTTELRLRVDSLVKELSEAKERLAEKHLIELKLMAQKDHFQSSGQKMKTALVRYYGLVEDLKAMITTEKNWSAQDFEDNIRMFHGRRKAKKRGDKQHLSLDDLPPHDAEESEGSDSESTDRHEFEAKRVKDAEQKIINEIFGGPAPLTSMELVNDIGLGTVNNVRKFDKGIQTASSVMSREVQTTISLVHSKYDTIFENIVILDELVTEVLFKKQLMQQFTDGELSEINIDENGIDQEVLSNKMRKMASAEGVWNDDTLSPPKLERVSSFNTGLQFNKIMDRKSEMSIGVKSLRPLTSNSEVKNYSLKGSATNSPEQGIGLSVPASDTPNFDNKQPISRPEMKHPPMFSIKVTKPLSEKLEAELVSAGASPLVTPKSMKRDMFVINAPKDIAPEKDNDLAPPVGPGTPTLGPISLMPKPPVSPQPGFTLQVNKVMSTSDHHDEDAHDKEVHKSSPAKSLNADHGRGRALSFKDQQGFLDVYPAGGGQSASKHSPLETGTNPKPQLKRAATRDLGHTLESPGVWSLVQQLTFEMNKTAVLTTRLQRAKDKVAYKDTELEKVGGILASQKDELDRKNIEIQELIAELERLRSKVVQEKEAEDEQLGSPEKKKVDKKQKLAKKEENRKLIQDYQQQMGPEQHIKVGNQAKALIALLNKGMFSAFKTPMSLKSVMRTINTLIADRAAEVKQKPETRHQSFSQFVYTYYQQVFGIQQISEKKFTYFVLSLKMYGQYFRVNMFSKFIGLLDGHKIDEELILKYMEALEFMERSNKGFPVKNKETAIKILYPFIRADEYCKYFFDGKITSDEIYNFRQSLEKLKETDPTGMNTAVVDFDIFMDKLLERYNTILNRNKQYVIDAFKACDLDGNNTCSVNEFILLNRYLEPNTFELNGCVKSFFDHADLVDTNDTGMSFDRFAIVCTNMNIFSEKSQNSFLGISNNNELQGLFGKVKSNWRISCEKLLRRLREFKTLVPEEAESWRNILEVLNKRMEQEETKELKPTLIAYFMTEKEFQRIQEEDEDLNLSDDDDLVQAMNKKHPELCSAIKSRSGPSEPQEEEDFFSERMRSAVKRHSKVLDPSNNPSQQQQEEGGPLKLQLEYCD